MIHTVYSSISYRITYLFPVFNNWEVFTGDASSVFFTPLTCQLILFLDLVSYFSFFFNFLNLLTGSFPEFRTFSAKKTPENNLHRFLTFYQYCIFYLPLFYILYSAFISPIMYGKHLKTQALTRKEPSCRQNKPAQQIQAQYDTSQTP